VPPPDTCADYTSASFLETYPMAFQGLRRTLMGAAIASLTLLAACGGGSLVSQFQPQRVIAFGDAMVDVGQTGRRYTIDDGSTNIWVQQLAASYGLSLTAASAGGTGYGTGNARVVASPDAAGEASTRTVAQQVSDFLAAGSFRDGDLVVVQAGTSDIITQVTRTNAGLQTSAQALAAIEQAARDLASQVGRIVDTGAQRVVVAGTFNLGRTPWAAGLGQAALLETYSRRFNELLLIGLVGRGANVLYVDQALYYNLVTASPSGYLGSNANATTPACASVDAGPGIGIGEGRISAYPCDATTLQAGIDAGRYFFADPVYPTPAAHRLFGIEAYNRIRGRW
jgi:outer membrane lipase/esterase